LSDGTGEEKKRRGAINNRKEGGRFPVKGFHAGHVGSYADRGLRKEKRGAAAEERRKREGKKSQHELMCLHSVGTTATVPVVLELRNWSTGGMGHEEKKREASY